MVENTREIKLDTEQILLEIERLREQLPKNSHNNFMLDRYLDQLTSYAETVFDEDADASKERAVSDNESFDSAAPVESLTAQFNDVAVQLESVATPQRSQIRKKAVEHAQRIQEEFRRGHGQSKPNDGTDKTDNGDTSGDAFDIETRVARIKARVAELTGAESFLVTPITLLTLYRRPCTDGANSHGSQYSIAGAQSTSPGGRNSSRRQQKSTITQLSTARLQATKLTHKK